MRIKDRLESCSVNSLSDKSRLSADREHAIHAYPWRLWHGFRSDSTGKVHNSFPLPHWALPGKPCDYRRKTTLKDDIEKLEDKDKRPCLLLEFARLKNHGKASLEIEGKLCIRLQANLMRIESFPKTTCPQKCDFV